MKARGWRPKSTDRSPPVRRRSQPVDWLPSVLIACGVLLLLGAIAYAGFYLLHTWLISQDRFLTSQEFARIPISDGGMSMSPAPTPTSVPDPSPTDSSASSPAVPTEGKATALPAGIPTALTVDAPTAGPTATMASLPEGTSTVASPPPVRVQIPAINVDRTVVEVLHLVDPVTGEWARDVSTLLRPGRQDLVGHWADSVYPGQVGNLILVGHSGGDGYSGAFMQLGRLKAGQEVLLINELGQRFAYRITDVQRVQLADPDGAEAGRHTGFLSVGGPERLTLVTSGGGDGATESERVYAIAVPVR